MEKDWQTTSDSLALWLAAKLSARHLCLVKSADVNGKSIKELMDQEIVDNHFEKYLQKYSGQVHFYQSTGVKHFIQDLDKGVFG